MSIKHSALHAAEKKEGVGWAGMVPNSKRVTIMLTGEVTSDMSAVPSSLETPRGPHFTPAFGSCRI